MSAFADDLELLIERSRGSVDAKCRLREVLSENAPAILKLVRAAESMMPTWEQAKRMGHSGGGMQRLQDALAELKGAKS